MPSLTEIFSTEGMQGSWEIIKKLSMVGIIVQWFLSVLGLLSNVSVLIRTTATIFYLSNRNFFDGIDEAKTNNTNNLRDAKGFDKIVEIVKIIVPNIKAYSDYGSTQFYLDDDDTTLTYIVKSAPSTISIIFFSTMAFNGLLFQIYANITDGLIAIANQAKELKIAKMVDDWFASGKEYKITLDKDGTNRGKLSGKVARSVYMDMSDKMGAISADEKAFWGSHVENFCSGTRFKDAVISRAKIMPDVEKYVQANGGKEEVYWDAINIQVAPSGYTLEGQRVPSDISTIGEQSSSKAFFVPNSVIFGDAGKSSPSFTGYMVSVSSKVPAESTFQLKKK